MSSYNKVNGSYVGENKAFIGKYAQKPRYQGSGSSHINSKKVTSALDAIKQAGITNITFAKGYDDQIDAVDEVLVAKLSAERLLIFCLAM